GLKIHAKCLLIVRREGDGVRHYLHIGTGNYHTKTARLYTDFGLFTTDPELAADVADMFNFLTGYARPRRYRKVLVAPNFLRDGGRPRGLGGGPLPRALADLRLRAPRLRPGGPDRLGGPHAPQPRRPGGAGGPGRGPAGARRGARRARALAGRRGERLGPAGGRPLAAAGPG